MAACRDASKLLAHYSGEVRVGDLRDPDYLDRVFTGVDIVCHTAGWSSFEKSGDTCNKTYLEPTLDLINHAIEWRIKRFVNLSSLYAAKPNQRNNADSIGKPRAYWPMINCLIAIEDYLRAYTNSHTQFVNLRLGLYSGKRINMGLLPLLLARNNHSSLPYLSGSLGHLPLIDGKDIGQAFVRAALAPIDASYSTLNICGPETPSHFEVMQFIKEQTQQSPLSYGLPSPIANFILCSQGKFQRFNQQPLLTSAMIDMLKSPVISNQQASKSLGFDPEVSWKASLLDTLETSRNQTLNTDLSQPCNKFNLN